MGMVMRNHELFESVTEDRNSDVSVSVSIDAFELSGDLDPSVDLMGKQVMEYLLSSLLGFSLSSGPKPSVRFSPIVPTVGAVQTLIVFSTWSNGRSVDRRIVRVRCLSLWIFPEVDAWREVAEDRNSDVSVSVSIDAFEHSGDLDPSVDLIGEPVIEYLISSLLGLSLSSGPNPSVRFSPIIPTVGAVQTLIVFSTGSNGRSVDRRSKGLIPTLNYLLGEGVECTSNIAFSVASPLATLQPFRREDLYESNWY
ncbi:hypothetical protein AYI68_g1843 [Smittium mucronatum]|uniref:Uncharacterized protein n=1 Tax=Smittium mucronatum TaxID=133383 RepID=A0A1R0H4J2_9FUNG|nr:hypothetical protein AYI68_g1843 [Smittium mucronatum]